MCIDLRSNARRHDPAALLAHGLAHRDLEHARACLAIASRYDRKSLGPGKLDVRGGAPATSLADAVRAAIVEGCIGETLSALLAEARLARAEDADVRAALERVAEEEASHAELAWRFVGWAIHTGGSEIRSVASTTFATALAALPQGWDSNLEDIKPHTLRRHGLLDAKTAQQIAERMVIDIVKPCARAMEMHAPIAA